MHSFLIAVKLFGMFAAAFSTFVFSALALWHANNGRHRALNTVWYSALVFLSVWAAVAIITSLP